MTKANFLSLFIILVLDIVVAIAAFIEGQTQVALLTAGFAVLVGGILVVRRKQAREASQSAPTGEGE